MPVSSIVCCSEVSLGFSTVSVEDDFVAEFDDEFELPLAVFEFEPGVPVNCLSRSPRPQNVSANDIRPKVKK